MHPTDLVLFMFSASSAATGSRSHCLAPICIVGESCLYELPPCVKISPEQRFKSEWFWIEGNFLQGTPTKPETVDLRKYLDALSCPIALTVVNKNHTSAPVDCDLEKSDGLRILFKWMLMTHGVSTGADHLKQISQPKPDSSVFGEKDSELEEDDSRHLISTGPQYELNDSFPNSVDEVQTLDFRQFDQEHFQVESEVRLSPSLRAGPQYQETIPDEPWRDLPSGDLYQRENPELDTESGSSLNAGFKATSFLHKLALLMIIISAALSIYRYKRRKTLTEAPPKYQEFV